MPYIPNDPRFSMGRTMIEPGSETGIELEAEYEKMRVMQKINGVQIHEVKSMVREYSTRINDSIQELILTIQDFNQALGDLLDE